MYRILNSGNKVARAIYAKEEEQVNKQKSSALYTFNGLENESGILD